jgi:hypothetical protein
MKGRINLLRSAGSTLDFIIGNLGSFMDRSDGLAVLDDDLDGIFGRLGLHLGDRAVSLGSRGGLQGRVWADEDEPQERKRSQNEKGNPGNLSIGGVGH